MSALFDQLLSYGMPEQLAYSFAELLPRLDGDPASTQYAQQLSDDLLCYVESCKRLAPDEVPQMRIQPHQGLVLTARQEPWNLKDAIVEIMTARLDEHASSMLLCGQFDEVVERLAADVLDIAHASDDEIHARFDSTKSSASRM